MSTLIIGGNGYIGTALSQYLHADVIDIGWYGSQISLEKNIEFYDNIILLAGHSSIWMCEKDPEFSWENNVNVFKRLIHKLPKDRLLIYASSASVYGSGNDNASETDPIASPICHYDMQKQIIDNIASKYIKDGKRVVGLRFGTVNGISDHTRIDLMINSMVNNAINDGQITLANIDKKRALLFLPDLIKAFELIINNDKSGIYNLSSINITVGEVGQRVSDLLNVSSIVDNSIQNPYSFGIDSSSFINTFGNYKNTSIDDIIVNLAANINNVRKTRRDQIYIP